MHFHDFRLDKLTTQQRILAAISLIFVVHFVLGTGLWLLFIYCQTVAVIRNSTPTNFYHNLAGWLPFYSRIWKSTTPLGLSVVALCLIPYRPRLSIKLLSGIAVFSVICAWYDISSENYDLATFGPPWEGHMIHYFTWWWCRQRPS